jgi:hypothetical protein
MTHPGGEIRIGERAVAAASTPASESSRKGG